MPYAITTSQPGTGELTWVGTGVQAGNNNARVLAVPAVMLAHAVTVCWHMSGPNNSVETASGPDDIAMATNGRDLLPDYQSVVGTGCVHHFHLARYLEVNPTGDWSIRVSVEETPLPTATHRAAPRKSRPRVHARHTSKAAPKPKPARTHTRPPAPAPVRSSPAPATCYPLTNGGNCYEPGEFCRHSDEGMSGVAGNGEAIKCEDNDGLRWEPV